MVLIFLHLNNNLKEYISNNFENFNETDKKVRKYAKSNQEYVANYVANSKKINLVKFHILLRNDTLEIDTKLKRGEGKIINCIDWKFCILNDGVENNFPHTINDVIFLPQSFINWEKDDRLRVLLHEKFHIYQRRYPCETNTLYLKYWRLQPFILNEHSSTRIHMRFNPDNNLFQYAYYDPKSDSFCYNVQIYKSSAKKLNDSRTVTIDRPHTRHGRFKNDDTYWSILQRGDVKQTESANEVMACLCTELVLNEKAPPDYPTMSWMRVFL